MQVEDQNRIQIVGKTYEIIKNHREGWNPEVFKERYSEVLDRYDYIVGDWGYNQLRLKGFYRDPQRGNKESLYYSIEDYIVEHCNFGCAHFVLKRIKGNQPSKEA